MPDKIRSKEFIIFSIFLFLITGIFLFYHKSELYTVSAAGENWLAGWSRRAAITVTNSSGGALTNYQVSVTVTYDSDMQTDFDDIRFTTSDGSTLMDYWLESKTDSSTAKFWVEITSLATGANTIYIYYGNSSATSISNGENTFLFFDHFTGTAINSAVWTGALAYTSVSDSVLTMNGSGWQKIYSTYVATTSTTSYRLRTRSYEVSGNSNVGFEPNPCCAGRAMAYMTGLNTASQGTTMGLFSYGVWYNFEIIYQPTVSVKFYVNDVLKVTHTCNSPGNLPASVGSYDATGMKVDWIFISKFVVTEPTLVIGSEEVVTIPVLAQVTAVPTPTADTTPNYTFSSTKAGTINYSGNCFSATTSAIAGNNTITFNVLASGTHSNCKISVTDSYGAQSALLSVNTFIVDAVAPTLAQVTAVPTPIVYVKPSYTFSSNENGTITYAGDCSSAITTAIAGNNTITFNTLAAGTHSNCTIKVTDSLSNQSTALAVNSFTINSYNSTTYTSANLSCFVTSGTCTGTTIFNLYDYLGGHAELSTQANYLFKVCCTGIGISNSCSGNYDTVLKLSGNTNAHAEKKSQSNYSGNNVCLHSDSMSVFCDYNTSCSAIGSDFVCLASISGDTNAHIGDCSSPYTTKVCCRIGATINSCSAKVVSNKSIALKDADIQLCSGADITNTSDPCYSICWKGVGTPNLSSSDWKCSVCYDSGNNPVSCSTAASTTIEWVMPTGYVTPTDYTLVSGTLTSANPVVRFVAQDDDRIINLNINSYGKSCSGQNSGQFVPTWREISPF